jgi:hypothetical protein
MEAMTTTAKTKESFFAIFFFLQQKVGLEMPSL